MTSAVSTIFNDTFTYQMECLAMKLLFLAFFVPLVVAENFFSKGWDPKLWEDYLQAMQNGGHPPAEQKNARKRNLQTEQSQPIFADSFGGEPGFYHGVASGDPLEDRVILWTKYTPVSANETVFLELRMAEVTANIPLDDHLDPDKNDYLWTKTIRVEAETDFIAKIDVTGLDSNKHYVFAFTDFNVASDVGQTRTAPSVNDDEKELKYCFFSCSNFASGYFHPYDVCSTMEDLDFWIHVGDYIYESGYGENEFGSGLAEREQVALVSSILPDIPLLFLHRISLTCGGFSLNGLSWTSKTTGIATPLITDSTRACEIFVVGHRSLLSGTTMK